MVWPTKNTAATDLGKLLGMYGLIITMGKKKEKKKRQQGIGKL